MVNRLQGAKALITGINSGVGCAIGEELARRGVDIVGGYYPHHSKPGIQTQDVARERIAAAGKKIGLLALDQTSTESIANAVATTKTILGGLDLLVTVASRQSPEAFLQMSPEEIRQQIEVNLTGTILLIREAANTMITLANGEGDARRHRSIGVMGSVRGRISIKPDSYEAAKGWLH